MKIFNLPNFIIHKVYFIYLFKHLITEELFFEFLFDSFKIFISNRLF